jgi:hypothetical protein
MQIRGAVSSVVGQISTTAWGQTVSLPHAHVVLEIHAADGVARVTGMRILSELTQKLTTTPTSLEGVERIAEEAERKGASCVIILVSVGKILYIASRGRGTVFIKRNDKLSNLLSQNGAVSGEVQIGDTLLLVSSGFAQLLKGLQYSSVFDHLSSEEVAEKLTLLLHQQTVDVFGAALVYQVKDFSPNEEEQKETEQVIAKHHVTFSLPITRRHFIRGIHMIQEGHLPVSWVLEKIVQRFRTNKKILGFTVAGICVVLLGVSIILGVRKQRTTVSSTATKQTITDAQHALDEGVALRDLNPIKSRERLSQAKESLEPFLKQISPKSAEGKDLASLYKQVTDNLTIAMQVHTVTPAVFFDPSLLKKSARASSMAISATTLGVIDRIGKTVFTVDLTSKLGTIVGGGDYMTGNVLISVSPQHIYILTDTDVFEIIEDGKGTKRSVIKKDDGWGTITSFISYGGNIYFLDSAKGRIWKYVAMEKGFSQRHEYLNPDTLPDLSGAVNMAIDGSVWIATRDGKILKFTQGKEATYVPTGIDPAFASALWVYTSDEATYIYVLDNVSHRVVVLDKDGNYVAQYKWESELAPTEIVVSEAQKKVCLLAGGSVWAFDLK